MDGPFKSLLARVCKIFQTGILIDNKPSMTEKLSKKLHKMSEKKITLNVHMAFPGLSLLLFGGGMWGLRERENYV